MYAIRSYYEVLAHPLLAFEEIARFKRYAELLERLWNSGVLRMTLAGLVERCFEDRITACLDALMAEVGEGVARDNLQPDARITSYNVCYTKLLRKEEVFQHLLPQAFSRHLLQYALIDKQQGWIIVDASSANKADALISLLRDTLGSLPVKPLEVNVAPTFIMTEWLRHPAQYSDFSLLDSYNFV